MAIGGEYYFAAIGATSIVFMRIVKRQRILKTWQSRDIPSVNLCVPAF